MINIRYISSRVILFVSFVTVAVFTVNCERQERIKVRKIKTDIRRVLDESWNKGNIEAMNELYDPDVIRHFAPYPDLKGLDAYKERVEGIRNIYPDHHMIIDEIIVEGNTIAVKFTWQGTHTGVSSIMSSIPPTGKQVKITGCYILHLANGKVVEEWIFEDMLGLQQQLGYKLVPPQQQGEE